MEKDKYASMKNEIASEEARYTSAKALWEQNLRAIKAAGKGPMGIHEKKVPNHQFQIDLYQFSLDRFKKYFEIKGIADEAAPSDSEESDSEEVH